MCVLVCLYVSTSCIIYVPMLFDQMACVCVYVDLISLTLRRSVTSPLCLWVCFCWRLCLSREKGRIQTYPGGKNLFYGCCLCSPGHIERRIALVLLLFPLACLLLLFIFYLSLTLRIFPLSFCRSLSLSMLLLFFREGKRRRESSVTGTLLFFHFKNERLTVLHSLHISIKQNITDLICSDHMCREQGSACECL